MFGQGDPGGRHLSIPSDCLPELNDNTLFLELPYQILVARFREINLTGLEAAFLLDRKLLCSRLLEEKSQQLSYATVNSVIYSINLSGKMCPLVPKRNDFFRVFTSYYLVGFEAGSTVETPCLVLKTCSKIHG